LAGGQRIVDGAGSVAGRSPWAVKLHPEDLICLSVNENEVCPDALGIGDWHVFLLTGRHALLEQKLLETLLAASRAAGTSTRGKIRADSGSARMRDSTGMPSSTETSSIAARTVWGSETAREPW
jgi:hypothetical protein